MRSAGIFYIAMALVFICQGNLFAQKIAWPPIRENDILWRKTVWRLIDKSEDANEPFKIATIDSPATGFSQLLTRGLKSKALIAYQDTTTRVALLPGELETIFADTAHYLYSEQVTHYGIKEEWIFDRSKGQMETYIHLIAPIVNRNGESVPLFWLSYPESRWYFKPYTIASSKTTLSDKTWDDYFESRMFKARITKTEGPDDSGKY